MQPSPPRPPCGFDLSWGESSLWWPVETQTLPHLFFHILTAPAHMSTSREGTAPPPTAPAEDSAREAPIPAGLWGTDRPPAQPHANSSVLVVGLFRTLSALPCSLSATWGDRRFARTRECSPVSGYNSGLCGQTSWVGILSCVASIEFA